MLDKYIYTAIVTACKSVISIVYTYVTCTVNTSVTEHLMKMYTHVSSVGTNHNPSHEK